MIFVRALCFFMLLFAAGCGPAGYGQTKEAVVEALEEAAARGRTLAGQQVNEYETFINCTSMERIYELTGKWPAILGLELMSVIENPSYRDYFVARAIEHAARGGIVAITWHARNPVRVCPRGEYYKCSQIAMNEAELERILNEGSEAHRLWASDVDAIADVLKELESFGVAPIFRPYHEMNGSWFWWGEKERYADLYRMLRRRLEDRHGLTNIVWAWSPDKASEGAEVYYPGDAMVDLVGADIYTGERSAEMFEQAKANVAPLHPSKAFAFTEIGKLPTPEIFKRVNPSYFLLWGGEFINIDWSAEPCDWCNRAEDVAEIYALPQVVTLDEFQWPDKSKVNYIAALRESPPEQACPAKLLEEPAHE